MSMHFDRYLILQDCMSNKMMESSGTSNAGDPQYYYVCFKCDLGQKYYAPQVRPDRGSNSRPPDHDSTLHVTETPSLTTRPSVTLTITQSSH